MSGDLHVFQQTGVRLWAFGKCDNSMDYDCGGVDGEEEDWQYWYCEDCDECCYLHVLIASAENGVK